MKVARSTKCGSGRNGTLDEGLGGISGRSSAALSLADSTGASYLLADMCIYRLAQALSARVKTVEVRLGTL